MPSGGRFRRQLRCSRARLPPEANRRGPNSAGGRRVPGGWGDFCGGGRPCLARCSAPSQPPWQASVLGLATRSACVELFPRPSGGARERAACACSLSAGSRHACARHPAISGTDRHCPHAPTGGRAALTRTCQNTSAERQFDETAALVSEEQMEAQSRRPEREAHRNRWCPRTVSDLGRIS